MNAKSEPRADRGLKRGQRLTAARDFEATFRGGQCWHGRYMVLWLREGPGAAGRLGVVAGRKVGGAVERNRAKRRLREVYRLNRQRLRPGYDVVLVARRAIGSAPWGELVAELMALAKRARLLKEL